MELKFSKEKTLESKKEMNYYGSLCTEMYEILHATPPQDELDFYLSFAKKEMAILNHFVVMGDL